MQTAGQDNVLICWRNIKPQGCSVWFKVNVIKALIQELRRLRHECRLWPLPHACTEEKINNLDGASNR